MLGLQRRLVSALTLATVVNKSVTSGQHPQVTIDNIFSQQRVLSDLKTYIHICIVIYWVGILYRESMDCRVRRVFSSA